MTERPFVLVESPFAGDVATHLAYARRAVRHSLLMGEVPFASHLLYTQILDDTDPVQREVGIALGLEKLRFADRMAIYTDYGVSPGMAGANREAIARGVPVEFRKIGQNPPLRWRAVANADSGAGALVERDGELARAIMLRSYTQAEQLADLLNKGGVW